MSDDLRVVAEALKLALDHIAKHVDSPTQPPVEPPPDPPDDGSWWKRGERWLYRPTGSGRDVPVVNNEELDRALGTAMPGDCINLAAGGYGPFVWSAHRGHRSGAPNAPITVQAGPGQEVRFQGPSVHTQADVFRTEDIDHFRVSGVSVSHSQFAMRIFSSSYGSIEHCRFNNSGHALVAVQDYTRTSAGNLTLGEPSNHITFDSCDLADAGRSLTDGQPFGEGFYFGHGSNWWEHKPHHITVFGCDITRTIGDAVDIKPGCRHIHIVGNKMHDLDVPSGSVISHGPMGMNDAAPSVEKRIEIADNRIWNIGHGHQQAGQRSAYGISAWLGGERIVGNRMWGFADHGVNTRAINLRGLSRRVSGFPLVVQDNVLWTNYSSVVAFDHDRPDIQMSGNMTPDGRNGQDRTDPAEFVGPVPRELFSEFDGIADGSTDPGSVFDLGGAR